jgi:transposase
MLEPKAAPADYQRWGRHPSWHLDEAVALTLGKEPNVVTWELVESYVGGGYPLADEFTELRERVQRAEAVGELTFPVKPDRFLSWLGRYIIGYPPELEASLVTLADDASSNDGSDEALHAQLNALKQANDTLLEKISELERELQDNPPGSTTARKTLLKIILGLAMACYGHDPRASRTKTATVIQKDLFEVGM